jgi:hypothetical protein
MIPQTRGKPYTLLEEYHDRLNVTVLGRFLEKFPNTAVVRQEYDQSKDTIAWVQKQRKKNVRGTSQCPRRDKGQTHFAVQDSTSPSYRCLYCCADMS